MIRGVKWRAVPKDENDPSAWPRRNSTNPSSRTCRTRGRTSSPKCSRLELHGDRLETAREPGRRGQDGTTILDVDLALSTEIGMLLDARYRGSVGSLEASARI